MCLNIIHGAKYNKYSMNPFAREMQEAHLKYLEKVREKEGDPSDFRPWEKNDSDDDCGENGMPSKDKVMLEWDDTDNKGNFDTNEQDIGDKQICDKNSQKDNDENNEGSDIDLI